MKKLKGAVITDANILIDYTDSNIKILRYLSDMLDGKLYVPAPVLEEVSQLSKEVAEGLGLIVFDPDIEIMTHAALYHGGLSFQDNLCILSAKQNGWICATNDKKLRKECSSNKVKTIWGLQIMLFLIEDSCLDKNTAIETAHKISENNREITSKLLKDFEAKVKKIGK